MKAIEVEGSHMMMGGNKSSILLRQDVATRRTALHEWLHRVLQVEKGSTRPEEDKIIEQFLYKYKNILKID